MAYQPAENLTNRTFVGLIVAQFLAGFNDQAIHASAMFYAIHTGILSETAAIALMPVLFFAPWAIFCTLAGYFADRYSKTMTLRFWKISEVVISLILLLGFYLGSNAHLPEIGGWIVMSCVFMMGTHAAFFAPAKYGAMPEILRPHVLSRGNGVLESTTFLASIFGTVSGGMLFYLFSSKFPDQEIWIGIILLALSIIGAAFSFMIIWLPAASPERPFPVNLFKPLWDNLRVMLRSRPLALAMLGIAFFVFMVAYMRLAMYIHGETRNPRWNEHDTSLVVATVALGVGVGAPFAGYLSGGKIELGMVPLGCLGMIFALVVAAIALEVTWILVIALIIIGFFSGFYMVPLYTLLTQRAPKKSKGELVATSNFINVIGGMAASGLFNVLVFVARFSNMTPEVPVSDQVAVGTIKDIEFVKNQHAKIQKVLIQTEDGVIEFQAKSAEDKKKKEEQEEEFAFYRLLGFSDDEVMERYVTFDDNFFDVLAGSLKLGDDVVVARYDLRSVRHFVIRKASQKVRGVYDNEILPSFLFLGAALMTFLILALLVRKLPDFLVRMLFWLRSIGRYRIKAVGMQHLPTEGPVILATNCKDMNGCLQLVSATDRSTKVILIDDGDGAIGGPMLRYLARRLSLIVIHPKQGAQEWECAKQRALTTLRQGHLLAVNLDHEEYTDAVATLVHQLHVATKAPLLPVFCGSIDNGTTGVTPRVRVVFGEMHPLPPLDSASHAGALPEVLELEDCKKSIVKLGEWIRAHDDDAGAAH